jgi:GH24 family phage-related lysozyme (muramidase)
MITVEDLMAKHEGKVSTIYNDSEGIPTIGIGHHLQVSPLCDGDWGLVMAQFQFMSNEQMLQPPEEA